MKNTFAIILATIWVSISEFFRNEIMLRSFWVEHYNSLGIKFPESSVNGLMWGVWSLLFVFGIFFLLKKIGFWQSAAVAWVFSFLMMWIVVGNLNVLPYSILFYAVPLSVIETVVAAFIIKKIGSK